MLFNVHDTLVIEIFPLLELLPESEIQNRMWCQSHIICRKAFVKPLEAFDSQSFQEAVEDVLVKQALAMSIDA